MFAGRFLRGIDGNHRIVLPPKWRPKPDEDRELFVVPTVGRASLTVMPPEGIQRIYEKLDSLKLGDAERWDFIRLYGSQMESTRCDGQGRMTLSREHIQHAGLDGEVLLVGLINQFEIWDPRRFAELEEMRRPGFEETARQLGI